MASSPSAQALPNIDKLADQGKYKEVISVCDIAIQKNHQDWKAYGIRGWANINLNKHQRAVEDCNQAITINKHYARAFRYRAHAKQSLGQYSASVADADRAISLEPGSDKWAYWTRGMSLTRLKRFEQAIENMTLAIHLDKGKLPEFYGDRGWIYGNSGQWQKGIDDYTTCIRRMPKNAWAFRERASANLQLKRFQESVNDCSIAIKLDPKFRDAYLTRAWAFEGLRQYEYRLEDLKVVLALKPNDSYALHALGYAYLDQWQNQNAIKNANCALRLNPKDGEAFFQRGRAYFNLEQYKNCIKDCTIANQYMPKEYVIFKFRGLAYTKLNDRRAIEDLRQAAIIMPKNVKAFDNLASCYYDFGMHKDMIDAINIALSLQPKEAIRYYRRSVAHLMLKQYKDAIDDSNLILKLRCRDEFLYGWAYWRKGEAQCKLGMFSDSIESCTKALDWYETPEIFEVRASAREKSGDLVLAFFDRAQAHLTECRRMGPFFISSLTERLRDYFIENAKNAT